MTAQAGSAALFPMCSPSDREALRREMRARRRALSIDERNLAAERFAHVAKRHLLLRPRERIAVYVPYGGEADPRALVAFARALRCRIYLPLIADYRRSAMRFVPYDPGDRLVLNRFGIPEPVQRARESVAVSSLDIVIAPLVAVDPSGSRLGSGAGFYDRCLRHLARSRRWRRPRLIGLAYEFQRVATLVRAPWDVPVDAVLTDKDLYPAQRNAPIARQL